MTNKESSPVSELVGRLRADSKGAGNFIAIVPLHALRHEAADCLAALEAENAQLRERVKELENVRIEVKQGGVQNMLAARRVREGGKVDG